MSFFLLPGSIRACCPPYFYDVSVMCLLIITNIVDLRQTCIPILRPPNCADMSAERGSCASPSIAITQVVISRLVGAIGATVGTMPQI